MYVCMYIYIYIYIFIFTTKNPPDFTILLFTGKQIISCMYLIVGLQANESSKKLRTIVKTGPRELGGQDKFAAAHSTNPKSETSAAESGNPGIVTSLLFMMPSTKVGSSGVSETGCKLKPTAGSY